jgi:competence protein ComEA
MNIGIWMLLAAFCLPPTAFCLLLPAYCHPARSSNESDAPSNKPVASLDINRATAEDFATLPGIGPELARRIVAFREKHGPFRRIEDLLVIKGMGRKKWRAIRPYLRVGDSLADVGGP